MMPMQFFEHPWLNPGLYVHSKLSLDRLLTANGSLVPTEGQLAESYEAAEDGMSVSFDLKDGITWHDGAPLTGEVMKCERMAVADALENGVYTPVDMGSYRGVLEMIFPSGVCDYRSH